MSKQLIADLFEAVDSGDWPALEAIFHAGVEYDRPGFEPLVGLERVMRFYRHERVLASGRHLVEQVLLEGEGGVACGRFVGVKKDSTEVDERFADMYVFEEGRIRKRRTFFYRPAI